MNLARINEIRASLNLPALEADPRKAQERKRHEANKRARAEMNRGIKQARASRSK